MSTLTPDRVIRLAVFAIVMRWNRASGIELIKEWGTDERVALVHGILFDWPIPDMPGHIEEYEPFELDRPGWLRLKSAWPTHADIQPDTDSLQTLFTCVSKYSYLYK
jgi:hypothetical protein